MNPEKLFASLQKKNLKVTGQRKAILEAMLRLDAPVSVDEILMALKETKVNKANEVNKVNVDKATVYRNVTKLTEEGVLRKVQFNEPKVRYEIDLEHHHHLVCLNCNCIQEAKLEKLEDEFVKLEKELGEKYDFEITSHSLEFYGICKDCSKI